MAAQKALVGYGRCGGCPRVLISLPRHLVETLGLGQLGADPGKTTDREVRSPSRALWSSGHGHVRRAVAPRRYVRAWLP